MRKVAVVVSSLTLSSICWAGGFEFPGNGTEALGRGAAFTAKADDPTAIEYNIAGLAQQRGTHILLDANLLFHSFTFQRAGSYPLEDVPPGEMGTPYAGQPFPLAQNNGGLFFAPFFGITTDFGKLKRWTFALGAYGPSSVGNRDFGLTVKSASGGQLPSPARYDLVYANLLIVFPTLAVAYRATDWFDVGVALQLVASSFDLKTATFSDLNTGLCFSKEFQPCDAATHIATSGITATAALGLMFHPMKTLDIGLNVRAKADVDTTGTIDTPGPAVRPFTDSNGNAKPASGAADFHSHLPWVLRAGVRYKFLKDGFEVGDVELDADYEAWHDAEGVGDTLNVPNLAFISDIHTTVTHHYQDTASVRLGGAYNLRLPKGVLTFRLGGYFDSAATKLKDTRLDFDTMAKWAGTLGLGYKIRGVTINVAYAYVWEPDRNVTNGALNSLNGLNGSSLDADGHPLPVVNNGLYSAHTQILSLGLTLSIDEIRNKK